MSSARAALFIFAALSACSLESEYVRIPVEGAQAMLIVTASEAGELSATAYALDGASETWTIPRPREAEATTIDVALYDCSLEALGLVPGELPLTRATNALEIPTARRWLRRASDESAFHPLDARPPALDQVSLDL